MAAFVDGETPVPRFVQTASENAMAGDSVDLGPLVGQERGFLTRERVPWSGGMGGVEMVDTETEIEAGPATLAKVDTPRTQFADLPILTLSPATASPSPKKNGSWVSASKGKERAVDVDVDVDMGVSESESSAHDHDSTRPGRDSPVSPTTRESNIRQVIVTHV